MITFPSPDDLLPPLIHLLAAISAQLRVLFVQFDLGEDLLIVNSHDLLADEVLEELCNAEDTRSKFSKLSDLH
jgi:hypothetical protein